MTLKDEIDQYRVWNKFVIEGGPLPPYVGIYALGHILQFIDLAIIALQDYAKNEGDGWEIAAQTMLALLDKEVED